jgi:uncharacterized protein HemY
MKETVIGYMALTAIVVATIIMIALTIVLESPVKEVKSKSFMYKRYKAKQKEAKHWSDMDFF